MASWWNRKDTLASKANAFNCIRVRLPSKLRKNTRWKIGISLSFISSAPQVRFLPPLRSHSIKWQKYWFRTPVISVQIRMGALKICHCSLNAKHHSCKVGDEGSNPSSGSNERCIKIKN